MDKDTEMSQNQNNWKLVKIKAKIISSRDFKYETRYRVDQKKKLVQNKTEK